MCGCLSSAGVPPGEEEDQEEGRPLLHTHFPDRRFTKTPTSCRPECVFPRRPGAHLSSEEPIFSGIAHTTTVVRKTSIPPQKPYHNNTQ